MRVMMGFLCLLLGSIVYAGDWTQWRGPDRKGHAPSIEVPTQWPDSLKTVWSIDAGGGYAGPLIQGEHVFVFSRAGDDERVAAYRLKDGSQVWMTTYAAPFTQSNNASKHGDGPFATPTLAKGLLITIGMTEILSAFDAKTGALQWRVDFPKDHAGGGNDFGSASSPLVIGDRCFVQAARKKEGALYCLDLKSGKVLWSAKNGGQASTPLMAMELDGQTQVIAKSSKGVGGFAVNDGKKLWHMEYRIRYDHPIVTPIVQGNRMFLADYSRQTSWLELVKEGDTYKPEVIWENDEEQFYMNSPVKIGDRIFGFSHTQKGRYVCLNLDDGAMIWTSEGRLGENAMLLASGDVLFGLTPDGVLRVMDTRGNQFNELAKYKVSDLPTWAPPVLTDKGVLVKDTEKLMYLSWK